MDSILLDGVGSVGQRRMRGPQWDYSDGGPRPASRLADAALTRSDGGTFTSADTSGRISLFFSGYTHCADVCPLTLVQLTRMRQDSGQRS